jgi:hypothetical protein
MKLYENFYNDGTLTNFYGGKTDSGYKLKINGEEKMKEKGTFTTSEGTGGYNNKPLNQFKITIQTPVEWLQEQYNQCPKYEERIYEQDWERAQEMEKEQSLKIPPYDLDELAEDMLKSHKDFNAEGFSEYQNGRLNGIYEGFQKAIELIKQQEQ